MRSAVHVVSIPQAAVPRVWFRQCGADHVRARSGTITMRRLGDVAEQTPFGNCRFKQGATDMGDKGKRDKGKKEEQKKAQLSAKDKRKKKNEKKEKKDK